MTPPTRLSERSVLILASLAGGPKHGYALIRDVQDFAGVKLGPGTLYGCLARLEASGLVEALPADDRRHPYRITAMGRDRLRERLAAAARVAAIGLARIEGG
jgi:DNA-binding PadR family transcriptional regulator